MVGLFTVFELDVKKIEAGLSEAEDCWQETKNLLRSSSAKPLHKDQFDDLAQNFWAFGKGKRANFSLNKFFYKRCKDVVSIKDNMMALSLDLIKLNTMWG